MVSDYEQNWKPLGYGEDVYRAWSYVSSTPDWFPAETHLPNWVKEKIIALDDKSCDRSESSIRALKRMAKNDPDTVLLFNKTEWSNTVEFAEEWWDVSKGDATFAVKWARWGFSPQEVAVRKILRVNVPNRAYVVRSAGLDFMKVKDLAERCPGINLSVTYSDPVARRLSNSSRYGHGRISAVAAAVELESLGIITTDTCSALLHLIDYTDIFAKDRDMANTMPYLMDSFNYYLKEVRRINPGYSDEEGQLVALDLFNMGSGRFYNWPKSENDAILAKITNPEQLSVFHEWYFYHIDNLSVSLSEITEFIMGMVPPAWAVASIQESQ